MEEKELISLSPHAETELSLNTLPMNLYRHEESSVFGVFTKYRQQILQDVVQDKQIPLANDFPYLEMEEADEAQQTTYSPENDNSQFHGKAIRKTCEA